MDNVSNNRVNETETNLKEFFKENKLDTYGEITKDLNKKNTEVINRIANKCTSNMKLLELAKSYNEMVLVWSAWDGMIKRDIQELESIIELESMNGRFIRKDYINMCQYLTDVIRREDEIILEMNDRYESSFIIKEFEIVNSSLELITNDEEIVSIDINEDQFIEFKDGDINCLSFISEGQVIDLSVM